MNDLPLRCRDEVTLHSALFAESRVRALAEEAAKSGEVGARRQLLGSAVRLTARMAPDLVGHVQACREALGITTEVELFVFPQTELNAACVRPEKGRVFVLLSSGLIDSLPPAELRFVVGHELGHHRFAHHEVPVGALTRSDPPLPGPMVLKLFAWSRAAEVSADRAGVLACGDADAAIRALFRVASGLRGTAVRLDLTDLAEQLGDYQAEAAAGSEGVARADWFATHPFSPVRLRAVQLLHEAATHPAQRDTLEDDTHQLLAVMDPSYLEEKSDEAEHMRRVLFAGGALVAAANGDLSADEVAAMNRFFGEGRFSTATRVEALAADMPRRVADCVARVPAPRRAQVLRDLCVVATADGRCDLAERQVILGIADGLQVDRRVVEVTLGVAATLD